MKKLHKLNFPRRIARHEFQSDLVMIKPGKNERLQKKSKKTTI